MSEPHESLWREIAKTEGKLRVTTQGIGNHKEKN